MKLWLFMERSVGQGNSGRPVLFVCVCARQAVDKPGVSVSDWRNAFSPRTDDTRSG